MDAEVNFVVRGLSGYKEEKHRAWMGNHESNSENPTTPMTRDLLGRLSNFVDSQELDLDLQVPSGWEKRLDLKSGKVYVRKCKSLSSSQMFEQNITNTTVPKLQDLNFPPSSSKPTASIFDESSLDLKLVSPSLLSTNYQSVCTLDKVKSALERAEKDPIKRHTSFGKSSLSSLSPTYSSSSSSMKETRYDVNEEKILSSPIAAGCPGCLSYILVTKNHPRCPMCNSDICFPPMKKPRIDLNIPI